MYVRRAALSSWWALEHGALSWLPEIGNYRSTFEFVRSQCLLAAVFDSTVLPYCGRHHIMISPGPYQMCEVGQARGARANELQDQDGHAIAVSKHA
jgi:hypothetical protein